MNGLNSHPLRRVTGWQQGFETYEDCRYHWLDKDNLLLSPIIKDWGLDQETLPLIINWDDGAFWQPMTDSPGFGCLAHWSEGLQRIISLNNKTIVVYDVNGKAIQSFKGDEPLNLSPSGLQLMSGFIWHDLQKGQVVDFSKEITGEIFNPAWSSSERKVFFDSWTGPTTIDVDQNAVYNFSWTSVEPAAAEGQSFAHWVLGDTRVMIIWQFFDTKERRAIIPMIDPATSTYSDLITTTKLNLIDSCDSLWNQSIAPNGKHALLPCAQRSYLIDLDTSSTHSLPKSLVPIAWTSDSRFLLLVEWNTHTADDIGRGKYQLLSIASGKIFPIDSDFVLVPIWSPDGKRLAYLSEDGRNLFLLNPSTRITTQISLTQSSTNVFWRPQGDGLAVQSSDGSLWYASYPFTDHVERLTPPLPKVEAVKWSPDGDRIAFVSEPDVYIVSVTQH